MALISKQEVTNLVFATIIAGIDVAFCVALAPLVAQLYPAQGAIIVPSGPALFVVLFPAIIQLAYKPFILLLCLASPKRRTIRVLLQSMVILAIGNTIVLVLLQLNL